MMREALGRFPVAAIEHVRISRWCSERIGLGSVIKKRRKKMRKHKHKKMLKKTRWQRRAHA
jgi:Mitochondrial domain of unknown function (DUF1713)